MMNDNIPTDYKNLENKDPSIDDKYFELVDRDSLKFHSKQYFYLAGLNAIFIVFYIVRWLFGISYLNYTPDEILENVISRKIPYLNTLNCTNDKYLQNPIWQNYPIKEELKHKSYTRIKLDDSTVTKICGIFLTASFQKNFTFNQTCNNTIYFHETFCPISEIYGNKITELMYDAKLIMNTNNERSFIYKPKIIPVKEKTCEFINEIDQKYTSFLIPFLFLIAIGICLIIQCVMGGICLSNETKDDKSRPPISSSSSTSYQKTGEIRTYQEGRGLISTKDVHGYVTTVRNYYHQIPKTGRDYFFDFWPSLVGNILVIIILNYYMKMLLNFHGQVLLVKKMGEEKCFDNNYIYNENFANYGSGIDDKVLQMIISMAIAIVANLIVTVLSGFYMIRKIGIKRVFCF